MRPCTLLYRRNLYLISLIYAILIIQLFISLPPYSPCFYEAWKSTTVGIFLLCEHWSWMGLWYSWNYGCPFDDYLDNHGDLFFVLCEEKRIL